jgi:hypothetical protein
MPSQTRKPIQVSILGCRKVIREILPGPGEFVAVEGSGLGSWRNVFWILEGVRGSGHEGRGLRNFKIFSTFCRHSSC